MKKIVSVIMTLLLMLTLFRQLSLKKHQEKKLSKISGSILCSEHFEGKYLSEFDTGLTNIAAK